MHFDLQVQPGSPGALFQCCLSNWYFHDKYFSYLKYTNLRLFLKVEIYVILVENLIWTYSWDVWCKSHVVLVISGGWNNNPTTVLFQSIFRRLQARYGLQPGTIGNITALDCTVCVCGLLASSLSEENPDVACPFSDEQYVFQPTSRLTLHFSTGQGFWWTMLLCTLLDGLSSSC
jgi:hypothetical protein